MNKRLIGSRSTEEIIVETWFVFKGLGYYDLKLDKIDWLNENCQGRWCYPASSVGSEGLYFENQEDATLFNLTWGSIVCNEMEIR